MEFTSPVVVVSRCLGFEACRYDGEIIPNRFLKRLAPYVTLKTVCPEVEIGLGTPRDPIRLIEHRGGERLVQPSTERDLTKTMSEFRDGYLDGLRNVDGFVLKGRSPSCGVSDAKVHEDADPHASTLRTGPGLFAAAVLERFPDAPVEDEERLTDFRIREHFLTRIFTTAELREVGKRPSMQRLVAFHARHEPLLTGLNQTVTSALDRIVANPAKQSEGEVFAAYSALMQGALAKAERIEVEDFEPFPRDLVEITDSGKGRGA